MADYHYMGVGKVYMREVGTNAGLLPVGNVDELTFTVNENVIEMKDRTTPGGGTAKEVRRIDSVEMACNMRELSPTNLARVFFGDENAVTGASVTDEAHTAYQGGLIPTQRINPTTVVVTGSGGTPTYTVNTDYIVTPNGIEIVDGGGIANGTAIEVDYAFADMSVIEAIRTSAKDVEMVFAGLNEANTDRVVRVYAYNVKLGAAQGLALITDEFGGLQASGKIQRDTTKTGAGESQYFRVDMENAA